MTELPPHFIDKAMPLAKRSLPDLELDFPERSLVEGANVTRVGPSPTGMMHVGTLYVGLLNAMLADQSGGVSILRIEDTDGAREQDGATSFIIDSLARYKIQMDEGLRSSGESIGEYGPYVQSARREIYQSCVKHLLNTGQAYFCFCTPDELEEQRDAQRRIGAPTGYYGSWARWRDQNVGETAFALDSGRPFVIRFKSNGSQNRKRVAEDLIFGTREVGQSFQDIVILKQDGLPTYHLAHVVDDHFMRTTHVLRGAEWLASVPLHLQLFDAFGWTPPKYGHIAPIAKLDGGSRRKLSKRKDPEASVRYFEELGYPPAAILDYLMTLASPAFEDWRSLHPELSVTQFPLSIDSMQNGAGPLFDFDKLDSISRDVIASMEAEEVYEAVLEWAEQFDPNFGNLLSCDRDYTIGILGIERSGSKRRKDITKWLDVKGDVRYFYDDLFELSESFAGLLTEAHPPNELARIARDFYSILHVSDSQEVWFDRVKTLATRYGYAARSKEYKANPSAYKGTVADFVKIFRVLLTGNPISPDLYSVIQVMGFARVHTRLMRAEEIRTNGHHRPTF